MATGIVSMALYLYKIPYAGEILFYLNIFAYLVLLLFLICRVIFFTKFFINDISNHSRGPGFLTLVAGTNILGSQFVVLSGNYKIAKLLYYAGFLSWVFLIYFIFIILTVRRNKPKMEHTLNGIWHLMVVSTQSLALLGVLLVNVLPFPKEIVLFISLCLFLVGCMIYIILITLIFYRLTFYELRAEEFAPPYWVNMGAVAITSLAGSTLLMNDSGVEFLITLEPFLKGITLLFWATGTWWIPIILILGGWRHFYQLIPIDYHPQYWGMVFPLGMYVVCTYRLSQVMHLAFLESLSSVFIYAAIFAWLVTISALINRNISKYLINKKI